MGVFTLKSFLFVLRSWNVKSYEFIDSKDAFGQSTRVYVNRNQIVKIEPQFNDKAFNVWLTDKGRQFFDAIFGKSYYESARLENVSVKTAKQWESFYNTIKKAFYVFDICNLKHANISFFLTVFENMRSIIKTILSKIFNKNPRLKKDASVIGVSLVSIIFLIFFSPVYSILWLVLFSFWFFYVKKYNSIYKIWGITTTIWYLIFTTTLAEIPILIGFEYTKVILMYLIQNDVLFANLCFQTVVLLDVLSNKLGFPIYIPAFINLIKSIINFFKPA